MSDCPMLCRPRPGVRNLQGSPHLGQLLLRFDFRAPSSNCAPTAFSLTYTPYHTGEYCNKRATPLYMAA